jgi:hypothetical protein
MTLYLRNNQGYNIAEIDYYIANEDDYKFIEIIATVNIPEYSQLLLTNLDRTDEIIADFNGVSELREWLNEVYFTGKNDPEKYNEVLKILRKHFYDLTIKYKLNYIED